ncbi:MAG: hypothetical protein AAGA48_01435 [Myxococcota bacterium]
MIGLLATLAGAQTPPDAFGRFDVENLTIVRPVGAAFEGGFDNSDPNDESAFDRTVVRALEGRATDYDFVMVFIGQGLPRQIAGAFAFNETHNRDLMGVGSVRLADERFSVRSALYMNRTTSFTTLDPVRSQWVFNHEIGHHWLAYPWIDLGEGRSDVLLGRQRAHWTYFLHTGNAPMEGNDWIDNGDGTFTTNPSSGQGGYSDLELYTMGLLRADEVAPFFLIEPDDPGNRTRTSAPDHWLEIAPFTVSGQRIDLTIDDLIATNGPVSPGPDTSQKDFRFLTVLVVGPFEDIDSGDLTRVSELQTQWAEGFATATRNLARVSFDMPDEKLTLASIDAPAWIPEAAR